ncbi:hypothetical protein SO802_033480 [Lithocarpus litseifolius]|uniref:Amidohydrolase-related domain-containing protein n=1 Tax=Lithocarpus litseifolius TaxID=425828 RepID=A0AAW2BIL9_9ROSI
MVCYWRIKEGHEDKYAIGSDFPTFASYGEPYIYDMPSLEFPRLIKVAIHGGYPCDPDKRPWGPGMALLCMYSMTPDEDFVIDFLGGEFGTDVVVGDGFSGRAFKMSPMVGRILIDLVLTGEAKGVELKHFRIARFEEYPKGNFKEFLYHVM